ncbi:MAG: hypothetical protein IJN70_02130, partial [Clostridia bacterium]|nr:hypothetical protein [Clostridia bacterium]
MKVSTIKKLSRKSLSVFLAVLMIMSTMSVCFGTIAFAAGGTVSDYSDLANKLNKDTIKYASWTKNPNAYIVDDPDGSVLEAVEAYWSAFTTLANKTPVTGSPNNTSNSTGSSEGNRTINQVNDTIKAGVKAVLGASYSGEIDAFLTNLVAGANVSSGTGSVQTKGGEENNDKTVPGSNITAVSPVTITVTMGLTKYTLDNLPASVITSKTYTITHANDRYDYTYSTSSRQVEENCETVTKTTYTRTYKYFYYINGTTSANGAATDTSAILAARDTLAANEAYFSKSLDELIATDAATLGTVKTAVNGAKDSIVATFGISTWEHFFSAYNVTELVGNIDLAGEIVSVKKVTDNLTALVEAGYAGKTEAQLRELHSTLTTGLTTFDGASANARAYIGTKGFNRESVQTFADEVKREIQLIELRALKATIDSTIPAYEVYTEDMIAAGTVTGADLSLAKGTVNGYVKSIATYPSDLVAEVGMGDYTAKLNALVTTLNALITFSGYNDQFSAEYAKYVAEIYSATKLDAASADIVAALRGDAANGIQGYDAWYTGLKSLLASIENALGTERADKIFKANDDAMKTHMDAVYTTLHARVEAEIDNATELYATIKALNGSIDIINVSTYSRYKQAFKTLDRDTYNYLKDEAKNFTMPQETIDKYNALKEDFAVLENFLATGGFSSFNQIFDTLVDRDVLPNDLIKDEKFVVDNDKVKEVIANLDAGITSPELGALLGGLLGEEGEAFDIAGMIKGLISDMLFSDATINMIMQLLYPLVLAELLKVWEKDLPTHIEESIVTADITYNKTIDQISVEAGLPLYPSDVADTLDATKYAENIAMLKTASKNSITHREDDGDVVVDQTPWTEVNPNLFNEDGTLKLTWGVDAAKEAGATTEELAEVFYQAFDDALHSLKPLLNVLVANTAWNSNKVKNVASIKAKVIISLNDNAHLTISASACPGYANLIVPIFEALGGRVTGTDGALFTFDSPATVEGYADNENSAADILRAIANPLFSFIDALGAAPVSTLVSILPNLCYALSMQMVPSLLGTLGTSLGIGVELSNSTLQNCAGGFLEDMLPSMDLKVADLLGDFNTEVIDLSAGVNSLLELAGLPIPELPQGEIAQMGTMTKFTSARYATHYDKAVVNSTLPDLNLGDNEAITIIADESAILERILKYVFGILTNEEAFTGLFGMLMTKEVPVLDENGDPTYDEEGNAVVEEVPDEEKIAEIFTTIKELNIFGISEGYTIAALLELLAPDEYDIADVSWYKSIFKATLDSAPTPVNAVYLKYGNDWTEDKAKYLADNLVTLINEILAMTGSEITDVNAMLKTMVNDGLSGAFTTETLTSLILGIAGIGNLDAMLADVLEGVLGADLSEMYKAFGYLLSEDALKPGDAEYVNNTGIAAVVDAEGNVTGWTFEGAAFTDGDRDMFIKIALRALGAFMPVLGKLLTGEEFTALGLLELQTVPAYSESLALLFEALGIAVPSQEEFDGIVSSAGTEAALLRVVGDVFTWFDAVFAEDANTVLLLAELLPNLLYFIESNGLSVVIRNLLHPVIVLVDILRPIIDVDVNGLLSYFISDMVNKPAEGEEAEAAFDINAILEMVLSGVYPAPADPENYTYIAIDVNEITLTKVLEIVDAILGTNISGSQIKTPGLDAMFAYTESYTAANGDTAYRVTTEFHNALTILVSAAIEALYVEIPDSEGLTNADVIFSMIGDEEITGIVGDVLALIRDFEASYEYKAPDWDYLVEEGAGLTALEPRPSITYLSYATEWTPDVAQTVYGVLDEVLEMVLPMLLEEQGAENLAMLVEGILADNVYNDDIFNMVVETIVNLFSGINASLFKHLDVVLDTDISTWFSFCEIDAETGKYVCTKEWNVTDRASFKAALETVLAPVDKILAFAFFGDGFHFFTGSEKDAEGNYIFNDIIGIDGIEGYDRAIVPILEALGLTLPTAADLEYKTSAAVSAILDELFNLIDKLATAESTVEVVFELLPNLIYFINADGLKNSVNNLLNAADQIIEAVAPIAGLEETSVKALIGDITIAEGAALDITDLSMDTLLGIAGAFGVKISPEMLAIIKNLYVGQFNEFTSANGLAAYKLDVTSLEAKGDVLTIVLSIALDLFNLNRELFAGLMGEEMYDAVYNLIRGAKDQFVYKEIDWGYMYEGAELADRLAALAAANGKMPKYPENSTAANYLLYQNNWNKDTAKYVNDVVDAVVAGIMGETTLGQMLDKAIADGLYKDDILNSLLSMVVGLVVDYAEIIEGAGVLLGAESISKWFEYCPVAEDGTVTVTKDFGIDEAATIDEKRELFVEAFVDVLEPAYRLLAWLLFDQDFTFFNGTTNEVLITLTGGRGYEEAFVPLLEAVGAKMPGLEDKKYENGETAIRPAAYYELRDEVTGEFTGYDMEAVVRDIFSAVTDWLYMLCGNMANQGEYGVIGAMLDLLPNVIYNINAGTVKAVVQNLLLPVEEILGHLETFGLTVDFSSLIEIRGKTLDIKNLDWYEVFKIVETLGLYWPDNIQDFLATYYVGEAVEFTSANGKTAYYMTYNADDEGDFLVYGREDMITTLISFVIDGVLDKRNEARLSGWLGADIYNVIYKYLTNEIVKVPMQDINWQLTEYADTDVIVSPITLGAKINSEFYGELYTREMGEYIEKWLPSFVDSVIVLLGVQSSETGENYEGLSDILNELIGTTLYTKENLQKILDLIQGLIPTLEEALPEGLFDVIVEVLKKALGVDLTYWNDYAVADVATGDRDAFVDELTRMLTPLYPVLRWLLTGENLIALFNVADGRDAVVIEGAEGYAQGIIPLLEAFDYQGDILTPDEFAALTDAPSMLKAILNPVLDVVDTVLADPVNEIFNVLPGVLYFVNSNGLDTVIKNTANAVFTVLENIEPLVGEVDLYELIGFDMANINIETLISELIKGLEEDTGFQLTDVAIDALTELTVGKVVGFISKNGEQAYTVEYATGADRVDMVTVVLRTVLTFVSVPENVVALEAMLEGSLDGEGYKFLCSLLENFSQMAASEGGMDEIMYTVYQIFYAANVAAHSTEDWFAEFNGDYSFLNELFKTSNLDFLRQIEISLGDLL